MRDFLIASLYESNSWPRVIGTASCKCVRPTFNVFECFLVMRSNAFSIVLIDSSKFGMRSSVLKRITVGITSFVDWAMFT